MGNCMGLNDSTKPHALLTITKWHRNGYSLIDDSLKSDSMVFHKITSSCRIVQADSELAIKEWRPMKGCENDVMSAKYLGGKCWVYARKGNDSVWMLAKQFIDVHNRSAQRLSLHKTIKIGRYKLQVSEIVTNAQSEVRASSEGTDEFKTHVQEKEATADLSLMSQSCSSERQCRICFGASSTEDNPLMESPCKCTGSVKLMHAECLQRWLMSKTKLKTTDTIRSYHWGQFACDVCKETYPEVILHPNGKQLNIVNIEKPKSNYILLESIPEKDITDKCNCLANLDLFFLSLQHGQRADVGRQSNSLVKLDDMTVSRHHAIIQQCNGEYYIKDANSKFGTLILQDEPVEVSRNHIVQFQAGEFRLKFSLSSGKLSCMSAGYFSKGLRRGRKKGGRVPTVDELERSSVAANV
eukprot:TRINITY_DN7510_c0_g3_i2.p1 TRINITY_DN7510_c0_g3~~TRINITY_DN7510_c0_g3_i2.p1  ORF type:complete len:411 (+),score=77.66 TRINITY_DN7510_c0_g3_i2:147-1379(+)